MLSSVRLFQFLNNLNRSLAQKVTLCTKFYTQAYFIGYLKNSFILKAETVESLGIRQKLS